jgi:hypothetical protein
MSTRFPGLSPLRSPPAFQRFAPSNEDSFYILSDPGHHVNHFVCPDYRLPTDDRELRDSAVPFVEQVSRLDRIGFRFVSAFPEGA